MNHIVAQQKASTHQPQNMVGYPLELCHHFDLVPIPLKPQSKVPLGKWSDENWKPTPAELEAWASRPGVNWGVRCGKNLAAIDCDSEDAYSHFVATHKLPRSCPVVKTGRGFHIWLKPMRPIKSQRVDGIEVKCLGSYVVAPPSIHPSGTPYIFLVAPDGALPEIDLEALFGLTTGSVVTHTSDSTAPSDFALRYGKSPYPQPLCGKATKVLTRSDGKTKQLLSLRCWKWHCPKCAPLLKRYWLAQLESISFRFILRLPTMNKPTAFLRHVGKPGYAHIIANGASWLFLTDSDAEKVWAEAHKAGYELVAGDIAGDPTSKKLRDCLGEALCLEEEPLNTRRKVTHSRGLFKKLAQNNNDDESKQKDDCVEENEAMNGRLGKEHLTWNSEVVRKPIEEIVKELEAQGWHILWKSEVEAVAIKDDEAGRRDLDIVELIESLCIRLKKVGNEYMGVCPFHNDHNPSLSVNREKGLWHCFGCGRGGDSQRFFEE